MFEAGMRTTLAQQLVSTASFAFDQTCLNRLATHFNISMLGHQTMFHGGVEGKNAFKSVKFVLLN